MPVISGLIFKFWDPLGSVKSKIREWEPQGKISSESEGEKLLTEYLKLCYPNLIIRNQFPYDRLKADIVIEKTVAIELKYNLKDNNEYNRLLGQIDQYHDWGIMLIVVVIGDIPEDYAHRIEKKLYQLWDEDHSAFINKPNGL